MQGGVGLSRLSTDEIEKLLKAVHGGRVTFPLSRASLTLAGFSDLADRADALVGLDERGTRTVLVAVLAERRRG